MAEGCGGRFLKCWCSDDVRVAEYQDVASE